MVILKFGGSSVATPAAIERVCAIVAREGRPRVVVVSALSGVTDQLVATADAVQTGRLAAALDIVDALRARHASMAGRGVAARHRAALLAGLAQTWDALEELVRAAAAQGDGGPATRDAIAACGEVASSRLVAAALASAGLPAVWIDAREVVVTDARHQQATPLRQPTIARARERLRPHLDRGGIPVLGGFIGATGASVTTTLGRGGSDVSASVLGACLAADEIQIWTDVEGMLTADPRVLRHPRTIARLSFEEASELAHFGAKVLHPATVQPALDENIPVRILNSHRADRPGTLITRRPGSRADPLAGLACWPEVCVLEIRLAPGAGLAHALAQARRSCAAAGTPIHLVSASDTHVSIVAGGPAVDDAAAAIARHATTRRRDDLALLAAVGDGLRDHRQRGADILDALGDTPVHLVSHAPGARHVAVLVARSDLIRATARLHERFFGQESRETGPLAVVALAREMAS